MARKVSIERTQGGEHPHVALGSAREGWELVAPTVGERYCLFMESGSIFRSSRVVRVQSDGFETANSRYVLRVLEQLEDVPPSAGRPSNWSLRPVRPAGSPTQTQEWVRE